MAEAAAAAVSTVSVNLKLPHLIPDSQPPPPKAATARVQHILNDIARVENLQPIFEEKGDFGSKTKEHVARFQRNHGINPSATLGPKTWKALLETWVALRPLPILLENE
jgi:peptidoglycan hydrolase-like protein with peptidoglycan-binding domain